MRKIDAIVVHCTAHPDTSWGIGVAEIRRDHVTPVAQGGRGWQDIGYHYVVRRNGEIEAGRMESEKGAHCPTMNANSIGVAWVGVERPAIGQRETLVRIVRELMQRYSVPVHRVFGHKEADPKCGKTCPNLDMTAFRTEVGR